MTLDLSPLKNALASLDEVLAMEVNPIIRDSAIQRFEYAYELSWKFLRRKLEENAENPTSIEHLGYKDLIRLGAEKGLINDPVKWFDYREKRNITVHAYNAKKAEIVYNILADFAKESAFLLQQLAK